MKILIVVIILIEPACQMFASPTPAYEPDALLYEPEPPDTADSGCTGSEPDAGVIFDAAPDAAPVDGNCMIPTLPCDEVCPGEDLIPWPQPPEEPTEMICIPSYCRCLLP